MHRLRTSRDHHPIESVMRPQKPRLAAVLIALGGVIGPQLASAVDAAWHYTLGEIRENQQGNFCAGLDDVAELANIFRKYGVLPGFSALSNSPNCETRISSFTPHEIVEKIEIEKGKPNAYVIRFLRVETRGGGAEYLITTRDVMPANR